jgi:hypothetical protein
MASSPVCKFKHVHECVRQGLLHLVITRFCKGCGQQLNTKAQVFARCADFHEQRKEWGESYCPDCGVDLRTLSPE